ncbi:uncharacterized protein METZ01_LOCUS281371 [marine metagenome]|jgi:hypothetical protein|uniref:Uncharacterized protein n=1 Tax=marine metagenome TaxID=408172 RepID=A0A382L0J4_9ZZZZ
MRGIPEARQAIDRHWSGPNPPILIAWTVFDQPCLSLFPVFLDSLTYQSYIYGL